MRSNLANLPYREPEADVVSSFKEVGKYVHWLSGPSRRRFVAAGRSFFGGFTARRSRRRFSHSVCASAPPQERSAACRGGSRRCATEGRRNTLQLFPCFGGASRRGNRDRDPLAV